MSVLHTKQDLEIKFRRLEAELATLKRDLGLLKGKVNVEANKVQAVASKGNSSIDSELNIDENTVVHRLQHIFENLKIKDLFAVNITYTGDLNGFRATFTGEVSFKDEVEFEKPVLFEDPVIFQDTTEFQADMTAKKITSDDLVTVDDLQVENDGQVDGNFNVTGILSINGVPVVNASGMTGTETVITTVNLTTLNLEYKDHAGANQTQVVVTGAIIASKDIDVVTGQVQSIV